MKTEYQRMLGNWAKEFRLALDPKVNKAINLANYDLWYSAPTDGSVNEPPTDEYGNENEWSGYDFEHACALIKCACEDIPCVLYMDTDGDYWTGNEPNEWEDCPECGDKGYHTNIVRGEEETEECTCCHGEGKVAACLDGWCVVERRDLLAAVVGKELAQYV